MDALISSFPETIEPETFKEVVTRPQIYLMNTVDKLKSYMLQ